jgi:hypothetical protein
MYDSAMPEQSAKSHAAVDPLHLVILIVLFVNFIATTAIEVQIDRVHFEWYSVLHVLVALALFLVAAKTRINALKVQDRVIRLEEQIRMARVLPEPLSTQSAALTVDQYIGLRFASDAELPELVARTLAEGLDRKAIKAAIVNWRPDDCRL